MHPSVHARTTPDKPAVIMAGSGATLSFAELDAASNRVAHLLRREGLETGDTVAIAIDNCIDHFPIVWGAQRAGLYMVAISNRLTAAEIGYIVADSGAKLLISTPSIGAAFEELAAACPDVLRFSLGGDEPGWHCWHDAVAPMPPGPVTDERCGTDMLYSSGTTGRPKGIRLPLPEDPSITTPHVLVMLVGALFGVTGEDVYLSPAPLYHAAPLRWTMAMHRLGATVVVMEKFDPAAALASIERHRVTASQWVPTHFVRMLKLPEAERTRHDVSSLRVAIHAAAPCPVEVKRAMIDWWGPVLIEYYAGTEGNGMTMIRSEDWLAHPGSVGRPVYGTVRICGEDGAVLPPRAEGLVYFEGGGQFAYHNDPEKTAEAANAHGWTTLGDIGWLDEEGYLYLTDRKSFMIISGGVNIYPQEIENLLITHPAIADVAVIGAPCPDMGEKVVAIVQPLDPAAAGAALADELRDWTRARLSGVKTPRQFDFRAELPRHPTGKLYKRLLRDEYWGKAGSGIV